MSVASYGEPLVSEAFEGLEMGDELYVGLFVCADNAEVLEHAEFDNVGSPARPSPISYRTPITSAATSRFSIGYRPP